MVAVRGIRVGIGTDQNLMDQPEPAQFHALERLASDVIPELRQKGTAR